jgi:hypothetical protein
MPFPDGRLLRLPGETLLKLELHLEEYYRGTHLEDHLFKVVTEWLEGDMARQRLIEASQCRHGYQWKDVFLVDRTLLRTVVKGRNFTAEVELDDLIYEKRKITPSQFANMHGAKGRNAWDCLWVQSPGKPDWTRASALRGGIRTRRSKTT